MSNRRIFVGQWDFEDQQARRGNAVCVVCADTTHTHKTHTQTPHRDRRPDDDPTKSTLFWPPARLRSLDDRRVFLNERIRTFL